MIELGTAPIIQTPKQTFGFFCRPDLAGKTFYEALEKELKQYKPEILKEALNGEFYFDSDGILRGSNSPLNVLINYKNLLPEGEHLLSIAEFGLAFNENPDAFTGTYQDTAQIARTAEDYFSNHFIKQIKARGKTPTPRVPIVVSNTDLIPKADRKSRCGFVYILKEDATLIEAPEYGSSQSIIKFTIYDARGIAIPDKGGDKNIWKRNDNVARVCLDSVQDANSDDEHLASSVSSGRVVVGKPNVPQGFSQIEKKIAEEEAKRKKWAANNKKNLACRLAEL